MKEAVRFVTKHHCGYLEKDLQYVPHGFSLSPSSPLQAKNSVPDIREESQFYITIV